MNPFKEVPQKETNKPLHLSKPLAGQGDAAGKMPDEIVTHGNPGMLSSFREK